MSFTKGDQYSYKYTEKFGISTRVGTIVHRQKVLKQAGIVHDINHSKTIRSVISLLCSRYHNENAQ